MQKISPEKWLILDQVVYAIREPLIRLRQQGIRREQAYEMIRRDFIALHKSGFHRMASRWAGDPMFKQLKRFTAEHHALAFGLAWASITEDEIW